MDRTTRPLVIIAAFAGSLVVGLVLMLWALGGLRHVAAPAAIGGPFQLTDQAGQTVTEKNMQGHPTRVLSYDLLKALAGKETANHNGRRARGQCFADVARKFNPAVGNQGHSGIFRRPRTFQNRRDLRHAGSGNNARGANRSWTDSHFQTIHAQRN